MRVFVSEYLTSGAWTGELAGSLLEEGRSMLLAIAADLARVPGCRVTTTWDRRLGRFPGNVTAETAAGAGDEAMLFDRLARESDAVLAIAPESGGELARRCRQAVALGAHWLGCTAEAIDLCTDKLRLARHLAQHRVLTIESHPLERRTLHEVRLPAVIKPRDGAGSQATFLVRSRAETAQALETFRMEYEGEAIWQPYIAGRAVSAAALIGGSGEIAVLPPATQELSADGRFRFLGGSVPADNVPTDAIHATVRAAAACVTGLKGYVGFDLLLSAGRAWEPILVEINPRLTTSYLGYRALAETNLAGRILTGAPEEIAWRPGRVAFRACGEESSVR